MKLNQHINGPRVFFSYAWRDVSSRHLEKLKSAVAQNLRYIPVDFRGPNWDPTSQTANSVSIENLDRCTASICVVSDAYLTSRVCMLEAVYCSMKGRKQVLLCEYSLSSKVAANRLRIVLRRIRELQGQRPESVRSFCIDFAAEACKTKSDGGEILLDFVEKKLKALEKSEKVTPPKDGDLYVGEPSKHWYVKERPNQIIRRIESPFSIFCIKSEMNSVPAVKKLANHLAQCYRVNFISNLGSPPHRDPTPYCIPMLLTTHAFLDKFEVSFPIVGCLEGHPKDKRKSNLWTVTRNHGVVEYQDSECRPRCKLLNFHQENLDTSLRRIQKAFNEAHIKCREDRDLGLRQLR
jgi:hypothetical protein